LQALLYLSLRAEGVAIPALLYCHCEPKAWQSRPSSIVIASRRRGNPGGTWDCFGTLCLAMTEGGVIASPFFYCHCEPFFTCHCERSAAISVGHGIASAPECLAMTKGGVIASAARQSHNSSYRSRHSLFIPLTNSIFPCLEPAFSCFSLEIALCISSQTS